MQLLPIIFNRVYRDTSSHRLIIVLAMSAKGVTWRFLGTATLETESLVNFVQHVHISPNDLPQPGSII